MTLKIVEDYSGDVAFAERIDAILDDAAAEMGLPFEPEKLHLSALDAEGQLAGGLTAYIVQGWLCVKLLAVVGAYRGQGIGQRLLARAEEFARENGLVGVYLDTFEFQAPRFYESLGYTECGRLPARGGKPQRIWFAKTFDVVEA